MSAGYHSVIGFFRDDMPLMELILDENGRQEIDRLWNEFDFIADFTARTWIQYFFNQSGEVQGKGDESGTPRPADHAFTDEPVILTMRDAYLAKAAAVPKRSRRTRGHPQPFRRHQRHPHALEKEHAEAEPKHLRGPAGVRSARLPPPPFRAERDDLLAYYRDAPGEERTVPRGRDPRLHGHRLMSPDFLYRIDLTDAAAAPRDPLSGLWRRKPPRARDPAALRLRPGQQAQLFPVVQHARRGADAARGGGRSPKPASCWPQTRRMLKDDRVRGLATEFGGNWLDFRHFETNNSVIANASQPSPTTCARPCSRSRSGFWTTLIAQQPLSARPPVRQLHVRESGAGQTLRHARGERGSRHLGSGRGRQPYGRGGLLPMSVS